jgi:hypothetical protein
MEGLEEFVERLYQEENSIKAPILPLADRRGKSSD